MDTRDYEPHSLVDVAYETLRKDIAERELLPGKKIVIRELHERYGISETPIKQALNRLIAEGLVESIPRKGMKVRNIRWEEIEELMDIRYMIETHYVRAILRGFMSDCNMKGRFLANLHDHIRVIENATGVNDYFQNYYLDQEFHKLFIKCSEKRRIMQIYNNLGTHIYAHYIYGKQGREETLEGVREHQAIYEALLAQDEINLLNAIELHIVNAINKVRKNFSES